MKYHGIYFSRYGSESYYLAGRRDNEKGHLEGIWTRGPSQYFWAEATVKGCVGDAVSLLELFHRISSTKEFSSDELYKLSLVL